MPTPHTHAQMRTGNQTELIEECVLSLLILFWCNEYLNYKEGRMSIIV